MKKSMLLGTSMLAAATLIGTATAQDDEIIVTATKREQTLQDVPVAVSVVQADTLEKAQINDIYDLQSVVPSLRVSTLERSTNTTFIIRGFGNGGNNIGVEPSVATYVDGVFRSRVNSAISDLPSLERVEVLRGPQNTLFGKGASAGVISIVTQAPQFEWQGSASLTVGNYDLRQGNGYVTGPLAENIAFSLAGNFQLREGYTNNLAGGPDLNDRDRWGLRGQLLFEPADNLSIRLIGDYDEIDEVCCTVEFVELGGATQVLLATGGGQAASQPFGYETFLDVDPVNTAENWGVSGHIDWSGEHFDIQSITAYREAATFSDGDVDFTSSPAIASNHNDVGIETFTQEIRIVSNGDGRLSWLAGVFYLDETIDNMANVTYGPGFRAYADALAGGLATGIEAVLVGTGGLDVSNGGFWTPGTGVFENISQDEENFSVFAQGDYELTDRWTATLGVGFVSDEKTVVSSQVNTDLFSSTDFATLLNDPTRLRLLPLDQVPSIGASFDNAVLAATYEAVTMMPFSVADYTALLTAAAMGDPTSQAIVAGIDATTPVVEPIVATQISAGLASALAPIQFLPPFIGLPNAFESNSTTDEEVTYTARLAWDATDRLNLYGSYATGFKPTSWGLNRDSSPFPADFAAIQAAGEAPATRGSGTRFAGAEEVEVFELGLKAQFDRGALNIAVFDQTIENFQSTIFQGTGFVLANAPEQSTTGVEWEGNFQVTDNLNLVSAGTLLDPVYDSYPNAQGIGGAQDLSGEQPAGIHTVSLFFGADYQRTLANGTEFFARADYQFENDVQVVDNVPEDILSREVNLVNGSMGLTFENGVETMVWVRNLTEDEYYQSGFPTTAQEGSFTAYPNQPRTYGLTVRARF